MKTDGQADSHMQAHTHTLRKGDEAVGDARGFCLFLDV